MHRRTFIALIAAGPAALVACGSDGTTLPPTDTTGESPDQTVPPTAPVATDVAVTTPPDSATDEPSSGPPEVVLSLTDEGGFTTRDFAFQQPPALLVTDDGQAITGALVAAVFPGPLLPQHTVQTISPAGIDQLIAAADEAGLLADLDLTMSDDLAIADASTTVLSIANDGETIRHEAYALGIGGGPGDSSESSQGREALLGFVDRLRGDLGAIVTDGLGEPAPYVPTAVQITTIPLGGVDLGDEATVLDWPQSSSVRLDDPAILDTFECFEIDDPDVVDLLLGADQATYFRQPGVAAPDNVFQVLARPAYPGRTCDA